MSTPASTLNQTPPISEFTPFALISPRLIILPTPLVLSLNLEAYREIYASVHASESFCQMAFGPHFLPRIWNAEQKISVIENEVRRGWAVRGMGDFAVGLILEPQAGVTTLLGNEKEDWREVEDIAEIQATLKGVVWVGYAGVRDAISRESIPLPAKDSAEWAALPPWKEMVEVRYGFSEEHWGKGYASESGRAVLGWAHAKHGIVRFIAETERANEGSGNVLRKLNFTPSGTDYWKEPSEVEWEYRVNV